MKKEMWIEGEECVATKQTAPRRRIVGDWAEGVPGLMEELRNVLAPRLLDATRIEVLEKEVMLVKERCAALERWNPIVVPIESLTPEPYQIIKSFHGVVQVQGDQYIATFFDANISASGDTQAEAVFNLKDMIVGAFEILNSREEDKLGPGPAHQRKVLQEYIRKKV